MFVKVHFLLILHSVHPPSPLYAGGGVELPIKFLKRGGGLTGSQVLEGVCWERGGDFFRGLGQFADLRGGA